MIFLSRLLFDLYIASVKFLFIQHGALCHYHIISSEFVRRIMFQLDCKIIKE